MRRSSLVADQTFVGGIGGETFLFDRLSKCQTEEEQIERLKKKRKKSRLIIIDPNSNLFHRSSIVREMKLNETDLPREDVMKNEKNDAVETEEWTHLQTSFTTIR